MRILNFGSLNIDYVYQVDKFVQPGETKACKQLIVNCGGKGLNQSIAAARAGSEVFHAGLIGRDGMQLVEKLTSNGVDVSLMENSDDLSGNAIIQVDETGQNCILLFGGTNRQLTKALIDRVLDKFPAPGLVLLQNETNLVEYIITSAHQKGLSIALNAAPMDVQVNNYPLELLDWLIINEVEGKQIAHCQEEESILPILSNRYPNLSILLTLGKHGAKCRHQGKTTTISAYKVKAIDTTAAGDTFIGYFLYGVLNNFSITESLELATTASAICVQHIGASDSIPTRDEVESIMSSGILGHLSLQVE